MVLMWYCCSYGAECKLDIGLYRLDQQAACQRYRQTQSNCKTQFFDRNGRQRA